MRCLNGIDVTDDIGDGDIGSGELFDVAVVAASILDRRPLALFGWATGESTVAVRDVSQRKLCGPPGDDALFGTGMIPKSLIAGKILGHGAGGAFDTIKVKHVSGGISEMSFKSYDQDRSKWQGATLDWLWCDEEPPLDHYLEGLARLVATGGLAYSTFTPLNGLAQVLPRFQERTPEAMRDRVVVRMRMQDAAHLADPERQAALIATFPQSISAAPASTACPCWGPARSSRMCNLKTY